MILQALTRYYDILSADPNSRIAPFGYSTANVSFALDISLQGELREIYPLFDTVQRGKKTQEVPQRRIVFGQTIRSSGISSNFLCDNSAYVLGISDKEAKDTEYALKRFEDFRQKNVALLERANCPAARAVIAFLDSYNPVQAKQNPIITSKWDELLKGGNLVFRMNGKFVHDDPEIRRVWEEHKAQSASDKVSQCLVTGESAPIARLHPSLKGIDGSNSTGATLVGFNAPAYESYNRDKEQGLNSPVSEKAVFAYTTALNYLLSRSNPNRKFKIGDTTVVYWAESMDTTYAATFAGLIGIEPDEADTDESEDTVFRDTRAEQRMREIAEKIKSAGALDVENLLAELGERNTRFYVLGLSPNAARAAVRFFHADPFTKIIQKIMQHYEDLSIEKEFPNQPAYIPLWQLLSETVSKKSSDKTPSPLMAGAVFRSILNGAPYPAALYYAVINRIRADIDDPDRRIKKINYMRAAIIKACLTRKYRSQNPNPIQEVLCMGLNEQSTNQAYLLGRLFAVLEKAQQDAIQNPNASITDRYFTAACASPVSVFSTLLRLSKHHISKAEHGKYYDRRIQDILDLLDVNNNPFPSHLSLDEQGIFVLGYYHQRADFYKPRKNQTAVESIQSEEIS